MAWNTFLNLPAPFGRIRFSDSTLRHIFNEHMAGGWPRDSVFTDDFLNRLRACWGAPADRRPALFETFSATLEIAARTGVERPLYLTYRQRDERSATLYTSALIVTPDGFVVVSRTEAGPPEVKTVFFPDGFRSQRPSRRWIGAVHSLVEQYATCVRVGDQEVFVHPSAEDAIPSLQPLGARDCITFHSPKVWGFREVLLPGQDKPILAWGGHPLPWPDRGEDGGATPAMRLKKPKR